MEYTKGHTVHEMMVTTTRGVYPASEILKRREEDSQEESVVATEQEKPKSCPFKRGVNDTCTEGCAWSVDGACAVIQPGVSVDGIGKRCPVKAGTKCAESCAMFADGCALIRRPEVAK